MQKYGSKNVALLIPSFIILLKESICTFKYFVLQKAYLKFQNIMYIKLKEKTWLC